MYFGAHLPIKHNNGKQLLSNLKEMVKIGGNALQIFTRTPFKATKDAPYQISSEEIKAIKDFVTKHKMFLVIHGAYIMNLCKKPPPSMRNMWAVKLLIDDLNLADEMGAIGVVIHMGRQAEDQTKKEAYKNMKESICYALDHTKNQGKAKSKVILETSSAEGRKIGSTLPLFAKIYNSFPEKYKKRIGVCVDSCHIFVAGEPVHTIKGMKSYFDRFDKLIGIKNLTLIHLNDSKSKLDSHLDRHAPLLQGYIFNQELGGDPETLQYLIQFAKKNEIPLILETHGDYKEEIKYIKMLLTHSESTQKKYNKKGGVKKHTAINNQKINSEKLDKIIKIFKQLKAHYQSEGNIYKANAYQKAITTLSSINKEIKSGKNIKHLPGIGKSFVQKIDEIIETNHLKQLNSIKADPKKKAQEELTSVLGIGPTTAKKLIDKHKIYSVKQLKNAPKKLLTSKQQLSLKFYDDLQKRIPRSEITKFITSLRSVLPSNYILEPAGSYRGGAKNSGDIDLIISSKQYQTKVDVEKADPLKNIISLMYEKNLMLHTIDQGIFKFMGITKGKRHIDIRFAPYESLITTIIYFSIGEEKSRSLRKKAKNTGYRLNEWGLYKNNKRVMIKSETNLLKKIGGL